MGLLGITLAALVATQSVNLPVSPEASVASTDTPAAVEESAASDSSGPQEPLFGRLHLLVIHFPIALLLTGVLLDWYYAWRKSVSSSTVPIFLLGVIAAWLACATGYVNRQSQLRPGSFIDVEFQTRSYQHLVMAVAASVTFSAVLTLKLSRALRSRAKLAYWLEAVGVVLLAIAGHLGGVMSHGPIF